MFFATPGTWRGPGRHTEAVASPHPAPLTTLTPSSSTSFALLNDEPLAADGADLLGAGRAAARLGALLRDSHRSTPFTLAIDAGWGMGKSSLMRLVDAELEKSRAAGAAGPAVHTVWYNAWTSTGDDALEGLIKSVLNTFDTNVLRRAVRAASEHQSLVRTLRALAVVLARPLGIARMIDEWWTSMSVDPKARNEMQKALGVMVKDWSGATKKNPRRMLVVFIDDLDRCEEATVLAICEGVKVYLDVPGLAFVIGCDRAATGPGGLLRDLSPAGAAFMEKIFQTSYRVPAGSPDDVCAYVLHCARAAGIAHLLDDNLAELLAYRAARNPRRIKRLVNGLLLEATLNPIWLDVGPEAVIRTLLLQYLYPDFYRMMTVPVAPAAPGGPAGLDVVREFTEYRRVRALLRAQTPLDEGDHWAVSAFLARLGAPPLDGFADHADVLAELERQLPTDFPVLVTDAAFTSLIDELLAVEDADTVLRRLREGVYSPQVTEPPPEPEPDGSGYSDDRGTSSAAPAAQEPVSSAAPIRPLDPGVVAFSNARTNREIYRELIRVGYHPYQALTRREATSQFDDRLPPIRMLICDTDIEDQPDAGFGYVDGLRTAGTYTGPVVFITSRRTPNRVTRAEQMGADIVTDPAQLPELIRLALGPPPPGGSGA